MAITLTATYSFVFNKCKMLSSYEGATNATSDGESLYSDTKIASQDSSLFSDYCIRGINTLVGRLGSIVKDVTFSPGGCAVSIDKTATRSEKEETLNTSLHEALVMFCMKEWCEDRKPSAVNKYTDGWKTLSDALIVVINRKNKPTLIN